MSHNISIVIPTMPSRKGFLSKLLSNIKEQQSATPSLDVEVIVEERGTECEAINRGYEKAKGEIVGYMPDDDLYTPLSLSKTRDMFVRQPHIDAVGGDVIYIDKWRRRLGYGMTAYRKDVPPNGVKEFLKSHVHTPLFSQGMFFRRRCLDALGGVRQQYSCCHDIDFQMRLIQEGFAFGVIERIQAYYTLHEEMGCLTKMTQHVWQIRQLCMSYGLTGTDFLVRATLGRWLTWRRNVYRPPFFCGLKSEIKRIRAEFGRLGLEDACGCHAADQSAEQDSAAQERIAPKTI